MSQTPSKHCPTPRPCVLKNRIQHYAWGHKQADSLIARLLNITAESDIRFAELWMGVHPHAPSSVLDLNHGEILLEDWLNLDPSQHFHSAFHDGLRAELPYLLKILNAAEALSIQAHPNREQAQRLHVQDPKNYPDANHKPEIAIAIDQFEAVAGFISDSAYEQLLKRYPPINSLFNTCSGLKAAVVHLLELARDQHHIIAHCSQNLYHQISSSTDQHPIESTFRVLYEEYGGQDVGLIFLFLLKYHKLNAGEALFLPAGVPHAYLRGNIIECMANSDNVVRVGLTPKYCDIDSMLRILQITDGCHLKVQTRTEGYVTQYETPVTEFQINAIRLAENECQHWKDNDRLQMMIVLEGSIILKWELDGDCCRARYHRGDSFVVPAALKNFCIQAANDALVFQVEIPDP